MEKQCGETHHVIVKPVTIFVIVLILVLVVVLILRQYVVLECLAREVVDGAWYDLSSR